MRKFIRKLMSRKGDSFAEILIAILIAALGCVLVATMYSSAMNMNLDASEKDDTYYGNITQMEQMEGEGITDDEKSHKVTVTEEGSGKTIDDSVYVYGKDGNYSFRRK